MTWIVKATGGYEYCCHPEGTVYGPDLSDAYRFKSRSQAARVVAWLNRTSLDGKPYRVVRLRRRRDRVREAAQAVWNAAKLSKAKPSLHTVPTRLLRDLDRALTLGAGPKGSAER